METSTLSEGTFVFKRKGIRIVLGVIISILIFIIGLMFSFVFFTQANEGYTIVHSTTQPAPNATKAYIFVDPTAWQVPMTQGQINTLYFDGAFAVIATLLLLWLAIVYAKAKDKYVVQNGKLIIDPEYYLRENSLTMGWFAVVIGVFGVLETYLNLNSTKSVGYSGSIMLFLVGIAYLMFTKLSKNNLKKVYIFILVLGAVSYILEFIFGHFSATSTLILVGYYFVIFRKIAAISKTPVQNT